MDNVQSQAANLARPNRHYFTAWRWHFYAGLYVIPFLLVLATTGLVMLWISATTELNGERGFVTPKVSPLAVSAQQAVAEAAIPGGAASQYIEPLGPDRVAVFKVDAGEESMTVVIDPYSGAVVETFPWRAGWYDFANDIHGSLLLGDFGDRLIETAASLGVLLVVTGIYLHWPRNGSGDPFAPRLAARGRAWWKSLHGVVGWWMSLVMLVFFVSGLSWAGIWGDKFVQAWSTFPAEKWDAVPLSDKTHADMNHGASKEVPWALEKTPMPESGSLAGQPAVAAPATFDDVVGFARALGFAGRFQVNMPAGEEGVWTISHDSMSNDGHDPWGDRTIHIDQYTGNILADVRYADYSTYAKMMAWGVAFHEGDMGIWNLALNTLFCLSMIFLPISGVVLWWKRRPEGAARIGAPPRPQDMTLWKGALVIVLAVGAMFPLAGIAMLAVVAIDALMLRFAPGLRRALN